MTSHEGTTPNVSGMPPSVFETVTFVRPGEVRMSEAALAQSGCSINDLLPGQWAFGQTLSVYRDFSSRKLVIDTFDDFKPSASLGDLKQYPAVAPVMEEIDGKDVIGYVADLSHMGSMAAFYTDLGLDDPADTRRLDIRHERCGAELLGGVALREFGKTQYYGVESFLTPTARLTEALNEFEECLRESPGSTLEVPDLAPYKRPIVHIEGALRPVIQQRVSTILTKLITRATTQL